MAVGGERAHPEFFGKRLRLRVGSEGDFQVRGSPGRSDRPKHASRPGLKPPFLVGLSHFQSPSGNTVRSLGVAANEECFGEEHMRPGAVHPSSRLSTSVMPRSKETRPSSTRPDPAKAQPNM